MIKRTRNGRTGDIVRLDVHDWLGNIMHRIKGKTTEKNIGVVILNTVRDLFSLTDKDISDINEDLKKKELAEQYQQREEYKPFSNDWKKPIWR